MKKGLPRIIIGCILIFFQLLSVIGNSRAGIHTSISFASISVFVYGLIVLLSYYFIGIIGVILLISGIAACTRKEGNSYKKRKKKQTYTTSQETHSEHTATQQEQVTSTIRKKNNRKYCSHCAALIDHATMKCTGCGKQYFNFLHFRKYIFCAIGILVIFAFFLSLKANLDLQEKLKEKDALITQLTSEKEGLLSQYEEAISELELDIKTQYSKGYDIGKEEGYDTGKEDGYSVGFDVGYDAGYKNGQLNGSTEKSEPDLLEKMLAKYGISDF